MHQPGGSFNRPSRLREKRVADRCAKLALPEAVEQSLCFPEVGGIDRAGNIWTINNYKPNFTVDIVANPAGDGILIFVGLATPRVPRA